jgi:hypothetical protein
MHVVFALLPDANNPWLLLGGDVIVIGAILLLLLAVIRHVLNNQSLSPLEKGIWIAIIL